MFKQTLRSRFTCLACQHYSFHAKKTLDRERPFSLALLVVACSRLRDGGGKSFSNKKCEKLVLIRSHYTILEPGTGYAGSLSFVVLACEQALGSQAIVVPLPSRAFSHARCHLRVSGVLFDGPRKTRDCL